MKRSKAPKVLAVISSLLMFWLISPRSSALAAARTTQLPTITTSNGPWTNFANPAGPADKPILSMSRGLNGYLWVGTRAGISIRSPQGDWHTLTTQDGLAGNAIFGITPDPANPQRHWFATNHGASLLDDGGDPFDTSKHRWVTFGKNDGMADNRLSTIALGADGKIWFGLSYVDVLSCEEVGFGINVLDPNGTPFDKSDDTWQTFTAANSNLTNDVVRRMIGSDQGIVWMALQGSLTAYQNGQWFAFSSDQGFPSNDITALATAGNLVWVGTRQGFGVLDYGASLSDRSDDRWQSFPNNNSLLKNIAAITLDDVGRVWLASNNFEFSSSCSSLFDSGAATVLDPHLTPFDLTDDTWITLTLPTTIANQESGIANQESGVRAIALEPQSAWLATKSAIIRLQYGTDLANLTTHQWSKERSETGVSGHTVSAIVTGSDDQIWFSQDGALYRLNYGAPHNLLDDELNSWDVPARTLAIDHEHRIWAGQSSVSVLDLANAREGDGNRTLVTYDSSSRLLSTQINEIAIDEDGWAWIANGDYLEGGLNVLDIGESAKDERDDRWATFTNQHSGLAAKHVTALALTKNRVAWLGSNTGAARLQYGTSPFDKSDDVWTLFNRSNSGLAGDIVRDIAVDAAGNVWFALAAGGVSVYTSDGAWVTFTTADGLAYDSVNAVAIDPTGQVWLGTDGDGVSVLDHGNTVQNKQDDQWITYHPGDSLLSGFVMKLTIDRLGQVWVGTFDGGLSLYSGIGLQPIYMPGITSHDSPILR